MRWRGALLCVIVGHEENPVNLTVPVLEPSGHFLAEDLAEARNTTLLKDVLVQEFPDPQQQRNGDTSRTWLRWSPHEWTDALVAVTDEGEVSRRQVETHPKVVYEVHDVAGRSSTSPWAPHRPSDHLRH